ncbi:hypothetical protein OROMI_015245 [Orobanche minor]
MDHKAEMMRDRLRLKEDIDKYLMEGRGHRRPDYLKKKLLAYTDKYKSAPGGGLIGCTKKQILKKTPLRRTRRTRRGAVLPISRFSNLHMELPIVFLFEFASGYALFDAYGLDEQLLDDTFESAEDYLNRPDQIFKVIAIYRFPSTDDALVQMNAISKSILTEELKWFLLHNLPKTIDGKPRYRDAVADPILARYISSATRFPTETRVSFDYIMRGFRLEIDKFMGGPEPGDLQKAQLNLARHYRKQSCMYKDSSMAVSSSPSQGVVVVPHTFEGLFLAKGKEDEYFICTKNLAPGEALYGDELIYVQDADRSDVEYRLWNPRRSKLGAAILGGLANIWIKPGSRVLYLGDVCGITVLQLSDLVGPDGLIYVVGLSNNVADAVDNRLNVITISEKFYLNPNYRMVVGMVDVMFADIVYPDTVDPMQMTMDIATNACFYLRAGGHYMITTQADSTSQVDPFADRLLDGHLRREFKSKELVKLETIGSGHFMAIGGFRMLEE